MSQRVRNLLKEIDTSLEESEPPKLPKLILGIGEAQDQVKQGLRSLSNSAQTSIATPRSIEDLTTDEKYGSFMPASHASKSPDCVPPQFLEIEDLEEETEKVQSPREMLEKDQMAQPVDESNNTTSQLKSRVAKCLFLLLECLLASFQPFGSLKMLRHRVSHLKLMAPEMKKSL